jgi:hypothetical protein
VLRSQIERKDSGSPACPVKDTGAYGGSFYLAGAGFGTGRNLARCNPSIVRGEGRAEWAQKLIAEAKGVRCERKRNCEVV